jgi:hypothetical protein
MMVGWLKRGGFYQQHAARPIVIYNAPQTLFYRDLPSE